MTAATTYRHDIQGLRAVAISLVVLAHAKTTIFTGGFVGVDVFFVLSGYLITGQLVSQHTIHGRLQLAQFYSQRLKRLLPALFAMLCLVVLISPYFISRQETLAQSTSAVFAASWTSNLFFAFTQFDYFSELLTRDLFLHTWSLGLEEQFYLLWPILIIIALMPNIRAWQSKDHASLLWTLTLLFVCSLSITLFLTTTHPMWAYYLMPSRIWQFALGAGVCVLIHFSDNNRTFLPGLLDKWGGALAAAGLGLIIASGMLMHADMVYPGFWALFPSIGAAMIIAAGGVGASGTAGRLLAHPLLVWIGNRSYSWYLWHWPVLMLGFAWGMQSQPVETAGLVALSLLLAMISYRWIELPFWKGRFSRAAPATIILLSILAMLILISIIQHRLDLLRNHNVTASASLANAARSDMPIIYAQDCDSFNKNSDIRPCMIGEATARKTVVLIGDSIGAQWASLLPGVFESPKWRTVILTKSSCPMVDEEVSRIGRAYTNCYEWRNKSLDYLSSLKPDIIFVGSSTYGFTARQWVDGTARILKRLTAAADHVIVLPSTPKLSFDGPGCLERAADLMAETTLRKAPTCRESSATTQVTDMVSHLSTAVTRFPNASLLNLNDLVCPQGICAARTETGLIVFRDSQHLTDSFVRAQIPAVAARIKQLGLSN